MKYPWPIEIHNRTIRLEMSKANSKFLLPAPSLFSLLSSPLHLSFSLSLFLFLLPPSHTSTGTANIGYHSGKPITVADIERVLKPCGSLEEVQIRTGANAFHKKSTFGIVSFHLYGDYANALQVSHLTELPGDILTKYHRNFDITKNTS